MDGSVMEPAIEPRTKSHLAEPVYFAGSTLAFLAQSSQQTTSSLPPTFTLMPASVGRHAAAEVLAKRARAPQRDAVFVGILFGLGAAGAGPADVIAHAHQRTLVEHAEFQRQLGGRRHQSIVSFWHCGIKTVNCRWDRGKMRPILGTAVHWHANRLNSRSAELSRAGPPISLSVRPHSTQNRGTGA
jgi:hypothetical protein